MSTKFETTHFLNLRYTTKDGETMNARIGVPMSMHHEDDEVFINNFDAIKEDIVNVELVNINSIKGKKTSLLNKYKKA